MFWLSWQREYAGIRRPQRPISWEPDTARQRAPSRPPWCVWPSYPWWDIRSVPADMFSMPIDTILSTALPSFCLIFVLQSIWQRIFSVKDDNGCVKAVFGSVPFVLATVILCIYVRHSGKLFISRHRTGYRYSPSGGEGTSEADRGHSSLRRRCHYYHNGRLHAVVLLFQSCDRYLSRIYQQGRLRSASSENEQRRKCLRFSAASKSQGGPLRFVMVLRPAYRQPLPAAPLPYFHKIREELPTIPSIDFVFLFVYYINM